MEIFVKFDFAASRRLTLLATEHPCSRVHGHTFEVQILVAGEIDPSTGFMVDFAVIEKSIAQIKETVDHRYLNDIDGLENPTTEILAQWLWGNLLKDLPGLTEIIVQEHYSRGVIYKGS
jgi:6-pyruvoyltetrahydropterin/6-carboxytetrahydropterin synthase